MSKYKGWKRYKTAREVSGAVISDIINQNANIENAGSIKTAKLGPKETLKKYISQGFQKDEAILRVKREFKAFEKEDELLKGWISDIKMELDRERNIGCSESR